MAQDPPMPWLLVGAPEPTQVAIIGPVDLVCATVDVAHVVTTHALATGDLTAARAAAQLAQLAAPYEEIPRLDLVAVWAADGHLEDSEAYLRGQVCNRSDDGGPPEDLSQRTQAILRNRQWLSRAG